VDYRPAGLVKEEQNALVRLTALNQRLTPMIEGEVVYVSADTVADQGMRRTGRRCQERLVCRAGAS
jgi:Cation efflux system protein CusB domain 1